jgi:O-methyltransferase
MFERVARRFLETKGYTVTRAAPTAMPATADMDNDAAFLSIFERCAAFSMTSKERMYAAYQAARHIATNRVEGDIVECGVWRGGSAMMIALTLLQLGYTERRLYLYDTFEGMSAPSGKDRAFDDRPAARVMEQAGWQQMNQWCLAPIEDVRANVQSTGYPHDRVVLVKGRVEVTIPSQVPARIALLRLDTDWYESTLHELTHLYPLVATGGVLIIDDYGYWKGAREATDQYFAQHGPPPLLTRIDCTGRIGLKMGVPG